MRIHKNSVKHPARHGTLQYTLKHLSIKQFQQLKGKIIRNLAKILSYQPGLNGLKLLWLRENPYCSNANLNSIILALSTIYSIVQCNLRIAEYFRKQKLVPKDGGRFEGSGGFLTFFRKSKV